MPKQPGESVTLFIERLSGGMPDDYRVVTQAEVDAMERKGFRSRYICTADPDFEPDTMADQSYDIVHMTNRRDPMLDEYVAII